MKKKFVVLPIITIALAGCAKTNLLYEENAYNYPQFDKNYYLEREDIDSKKIDETRNGVAYNLHSEDGISALAAYNKEGYKWSSYDKNEMFGYHNNLDSIESSFNYGILSKLYDGRVRCDGLYQKSRVQLNKTGYATYFPKSLVEAQYIAFACRGGTTLSTPIGLGDKNGLKFNFTLSFYIHITNSENYNKVVYKLNEVPVQVDNGGGTNLVSFEILPTELNGAVAMSLEWECVDSRMSSYNLVDDYTVKEKDHLAIMLYEVFIGKSTWR